MKNASLTFWHQVDIPGGGRAVSKQPPFDLLETKCSGNFTSEIFRSNNVQMISIAK